MKDFIFDERERVKNISLETLGLTADYRGQKKHEISHFQLFNDIYQDVKNRGYEASIDQLYIPQNGVIYPSEREVKSKGFLTSKYDTRGVIINTLVGKIDIRGDHFDDGVTNQSIAIGINKNGIELAFGSTVQICQNLQVFGGQHMQNFGSQSLPFMRMLDILASWIQNMRKIRIRDQEIHKVFMSKEIDPVHEIDEVIGHLHRLCEMNIKDSKVVSPLNHSRIHDVQRGLLNYEGELATVDNLFQACTSVASHQHNVSNRLANTSDLGSYFQNRYNAVIDVEFDEVIPTALV